MFSLIQFVGLSSALWPAAAITATLPTTLPGATAVSTGLNAQIDDVLAAQVLRLISLTCLLFKVRTNARR